MKRIVFFFLNVFLLLFSVSAEAQEKKPVKPKFHKAFTEYFSKDSSKFFNLNGGKKRESKQIVPSGL